MFKKKKGKIISSKIRVKPRIKKRSNPLVKIGPEKYFWLCDGQVLKNLKELAVALEKMNNDVFKDHVSGEKNDFALWVKDVFGEQKLATALRRAKTAKTAAKKIRASI